jgi:hypothetical protein
MVEVLVGGSLLAAGIAAAAARRRTVPSSASAWAVRPPGDESSDLPCPWCLAATREDDDRCPSCGQRFG